MINYKTVGIANLVVILFCIIVIITWIFNLQHFNFLILLSSAPGVTKVVPYFIFPLLALNLIAAKWMLYETPYIQQIRFFPSIAFLILTLFFFIIVIGVDLFFCTVGPSLFTLTLAFVGYSADFTSQTCFSVIWY